MRWFWIDHFQELVSGKSAVSVKCVTASEPAVEEYLPGYPVFPCSLILEGVAQTGGLLVGEMFEFRQRVVLAKVGRAEFQRSVVPGERMRYEVVIQDVNDVGASIHAEVRVGEELIARIEMMFAYLRDDNGLGLPDNMFPPEDLMVMLRLFRLFEVACDARGNRRPIPPWLVEEEHRAFANA